MRVVHEERFSALRETAAHHPVVAADILLTLAEVDRRRPRNRTGELANSAAIVAGRRHNVVRRELDRLAKPVVYIQDAPVSDPNVAGRVDLLTPITTLKLT